MSIKFITQSGAT